MTRANTVFQIQVRHFNTFNWVALEGSFELKSQAFRSLKKFRTRFPEHIFRVKITKREGR